VLNSHNNNVNGKNNDNMLNALACAAAHLYEVQTTSALRSDRSIDFQADYITVVEDRPIMSVKYCLSVPVFHFWPKL